jgi:hypothetical protein
MTIRATWPVAIERFQTPFAILGWGRNAVPLVEGCDLALSFGPESDRLLRDCNANLAEDPAPKARVAAGTPARFDLTGDWDVTAAGLACGHIRGRLFFEAAVAGCAIDVRYENGDALFEAPRLDGDWVIAISACSQQITDTRYSNLCGTWYANVAVKS